MMRINTIQQDTHIRDNIDGDYFRLRVTAIDHNETIGDMQILPKLHALSRDRNTRGLHIAGVEVGKTDGVLVDIIVPPKNSGDFKMPQVGDIVWCYRGRRGLKKTAVYAYTEYSGLDAGTGLQNTPVPSFGSFPGDYGNIRTYQDNVVQALRKGGDRHGWPNIPRGNGNFITQFVRSITGYRFRNYFGGNLEKGKFALRGDAVFDDGPHNPIIEDNGYEIINKGRKQSEYPNPLNAPKAQEENPDFTYLVSPYQYLETVDELDPYTEVPTPKAVEPKKYTQVVGKNKNYVSYQPILDKAFKQKTSVDREVPAADEYKVAVKGDNMLYIGDMHGDMKQLLILLKNMYDAGLSIVQSEDYSQVRLRDHVGNIILLDGDRENPRVIITTPARQVVELGHNTKDKSSFTYVRNGPKWGDADTDWGEVTGLSKSAVPHQEILMTDADMSPANLEKLSAGLSGQVQGAGLYFRNSDDKGKWEQSVSITHNDGNLNIAQVQRFAKSRTEMVSSVLSGGNNTSITMKTTTKAIKVNEVQFNDGNISLKRFHSINGKYVSEVNMNDNLLKLDTDEFLEINAKKGITIKTPEMVKVLTKEMEVI